MQVGELVDFGPVASALAKGDSNQTILEARGTGTGQGRAERRAAKLALSAWVATESQCVIESLASRDQATGELLFEAQGQADLQLARGCVAKLWRKMAADGRRTSRTTLADAVGDGVLALALWRAGAGEGNAAQVCWRAVVQSVSSDQFGDGDTVNACTIQDDWLWPVVLDREDKRERVARRLIERAQARRVERLLGRIDALQRLGGRGRRAGAIVRVGRAAALLLRGAGLDEAARRAGYTDKGRVRGVDQLLRAARRLGIRVLTLRDGRGGDTLSSTFRTGGAPHPDAYVTTALAPRESLDDLATAASESQRSARADCAALQGGLACPSRRQVAPWWIGLVRQARAERSRVCGALVLWRRAPDALDAVANAFGEAATARREAVEAARVKIHADNIANGWRPWAPRPIGPRLPMLPAQSQFFAGVPVLSRVRAMVPKRDAVLTRADGKAAALRWARAAVAQA